MSMGNGLKEDYMSLAGPRKDLHVNSSSCINNGVIRSCIHNSKDSSAVGLGTSCSQLDANYALRLC